MRPYLYFLALVSASSSISLAQNGHLDICRPSREIYPFHGPVKKVTEEYNYEMSDRKYKEVREYDKTGNLIYRKKINYKDEITYFATNRFDEAGCFVGQRVEDVRGKSTNDYTVVLNHPTRQMAFKCKLTSEIEVVTYNKDGFRLGATLKKKGEKTVPLTKYKRDSDNKTLTYSRYEDGRIKYVSAYRRDSQKRTIKLAVNYKRENRKDINEYEYLETDEYGNWTQRLLKSRSVRDGEEKEYDKFSVREIEYYEDEEL